MRKLNNPMPSGGAPFTNEDLSDVFQTEIWAALQAMLSVYDADAEGVIVSGCVVTPNAGNFDMTAGIVYLNGEFMRVDAVTNQTFTKYIKASPATNVSRVFNDTVSKTFIIEKKAEVSGTVDGSGQEITIASVAAAVNRRLNNFKVSKSGDSMTGALTSSSTGEFQAGIRTENAGVYLKVKVIDIGDWNMLSNWQKNVAHGLTDSNIRSISVVVRDDSGSTRMFLGEKFNIVSQSAPLSTGWIEVTHLARTSTDIVLYRHDNSLTNSTSYDSTSYNRGWITIWYEA